MKHLYAKRFIPFYISVIILFLLNTLFSNVAFFVNLFANSNINIKYEQEIETPTYEDLNIYFYPLAGGSSANDTIKQANAEGDSCIIKVGDVEILVDAGADTGSNYAIMSQMRKYVSNDNVWDYIIVTHADKDHIGAFTTNNGTTGIFSLFLCEENTSEMTLKTLIDFDITQDETVNYPNKSDLFTTQMYKIYSEYRAKLINAGTTYYTASQCCWEKRKVSQQSCNNANDTFNLSDKVTLKILYNYYNDNKFNENIEISSADKNNLSVCFSINYKTDDNIERFLFTGDLEEYNSATGYSQILGETKLLENNPELKQGVLFYKASHHGSRTSSSENFINNIRPAYVVIPAIAGNNSYGHVLNSEEAFPSKVVLDRLFKYTDRIYIPAVAKYYENNNKTICDYYGYISIGYSGDNVNVKTSNLMNEKEPEFIQNTNWYKTFRETTLYTYVFDGFDTKNNAYLGNCTLVKYGHYEILIDCGVIGTIGTNAIQSNIFIEQVKKYCVDNIIEYVIVTSPISDSIQQLVNSYNFTNIVNKGILEEFKINTLIDYGNSTDPSLGASKSLFKEYNTQKQKLINNGTNYYSAYQCTYGNVLNNFEVASGLSINILKNEYYNTSQNANVALTINFFDKKLLFTGNATNDAEKSIVYNNNLSNVVFYKLADYGYENSNSNLLLNAIKNKKNQLFIAINSIANENYFGKKILTKQLCDRLINCTKYTYLAMEKKANGEYQQICGDITFSISFKNSEISKMSLLGSKSTTILSETTYYKTL